MPGNAHPSPSVDRRSALRRSRRMALSAVTAAALAAGCASTPRAPRLLPTARDFPVLSPEQAWDRVVDLVIRRGWTLAHTERESGLLATEWLEAGSPNRWMDCGRAGLWRKDLNHQGKITFTVRPSEAGGSTVAVNIAWTVVRQGMLDDAIHTDRCNSKGVLEAEIYRELSEASPAPDRHTADMAS